MATTETEDNCVSKMRKVTSGDLKLLAGGKLLMKREFAGRKDVCIITYVERIGLWMGGMEKAVVGKAGFVLIVRSVFAQETYVTYVRP